MQPSPLDAVVQGCGATMMSCGGRRVPAHFGSPASEATEARRPHGLACVGLDALDRLAASGRLARRGRYG